MLTGDAAQMADTLLGLRATLGIDEFVVPGDLAEYFVPVITRLAGSAGPVDLGWRMSNGSRRSRLGQSLLQRLHPPDEQVDTPLVVGDLVIAIGQRDGALDQLREPVRWQPGQRRLLAGHHLRPLLLRVLVSAPGRPDTNMIAVCRQARARSRSAGRET